METSINKNYNLKTLLLKTRIIPFSEFRKLTVEMLQLNRF